VAFETNLLALFHSYSAAEDTKNTCSWPSSL
jgi:hypothetical protein